MPKYVFSCELEHLKPLKSQPLCRNNFRIILLFISMIHEHTRNVIFPSDAHYLSRECPFDPTILNLNSAKINFTRPAIKIRIFYTRVAFAF